MTSKALALAATACVAVGLLLALQAATSERAVQEIRESDPWGERAAFRYQPLAPDGAALPTGEPGYLTSDAPTMRAGFTWQLDDPTAERVAGVASLTLVVRHDARPTWTHSETLAEASLAGDVATPLALEGIVDFAALEERIAATPGQDARDADWRLVAEVRFASAPTIGHADDASRFELPIGYAPPLYTLPVENALDVSKDHTERETLVTMQQDGARGWLAKPFGPLLALAGVALLAHAGPAARRDDEEAAP